MSEVTRFRTGNVVQMKSHVHLPTAENTKLFQSINEAAETTGLSTYFIRANVRLGKIPHIKTGNKVMINMNMFLQMMDNLSAEGVSINDI